MSTLASTKLARGLLGLAALGLGGSALAHDQTAAGALLGAGAGAILGHAIGGPDAAVAGGVIGAVTGAAVASSHHGPHYSAGYVGGYGYAPPAYYPRPVAPVYVVPPPVVIFVPGYGYGYWHHGVNAWGGPFRTWVPAPRYYGPHPRPVYPGYPYRHPHGPRW